MGFLRTNLHNSFNYFTEILHQDVSGEKRGHTFASFNPSYLVLFITILE